MIKVTNVKLYENVSLHDYLEMPGVSFSGIKSRGIKFEPTEKMKLGSSVDDYLNDPKKFNGDLSIVKPLAAKLLSKVGNLYWRFQRQVSITADLEYEDHILHGKFRPDWFVLNKIVVDIKVSKNIDESIKHFQYPDQIHIYKKVINADTGLILAINPTTKEVCVREPPCTDYWWQQQILKLGTSIYNLK